MFISIAGSIGKVGVIPEYLDGVNLTENAAKITDLNGVHNKYLAYALSSQYCQEQIASLTISTNQPKLALYRIEKIKFPLPPLPEQERIVAKIEELFTQLEAGTSALERVQAGLRRYKASVLKAAVEGRLESVGAHGVRPSSGRMPSAPTETPSARTGELPQGWRWAAVDELKKSEPNAICAGPFGTIFKARDFRPTGVSIIFLRHVAPGKYLTHKPTFMDTDKWEELFIPYSVFGGELLITKLGEPPGVCAIYPEGIGPAMVTPDVIKMSVNEEIALSQYLMHYFNSEISRKISSNLAFGTTRLRLTIPMFRDLRVPLPPLEEQRRIVAEVDRRLSVARQVESGVEEGLVRAARLRQAVLRSAFEGKLT